MTATAEQIEAIGRVVIELTRIRASNVPHLMVENFAPELFESLMGAAGLRGGLERLDDKEFYEACQLYRNAPDGPPDADGINASGAFEALKYWVRQNVAV